MLKEENKSTVSVTVETAQPTILYSRQHKKLPPTYPINLLDEELLEYLPRFVEF